MSEEPKHRFYGRPMSEVIALTPSELNDEIGVGLAGIVDEGRHGFGLGGAALVDYVRRCLFEVVKRGGRPRHWGTPENPSREIPLHYGGDSEEEIVEGVIADWLQGGAGDLTWSDFRFTLPEKHR